MTPRGRVGYLQRDCFSHLYGIPRQTRANILDAQLGLKAYLGVQNLTYALHARKLLVEDV